jgi:hypothetical protein
MIIHSDPHPEAKVGVAIRGGNSTRVYPIYADGGKLSGDLPPTSNTLPRKHHQGGALLQRGVGSGLVDIGNQPLEKHPIIRPVPSGPPRLPLIRLKKSTTGGDIASSIPYNIPSDNQ